MKRHYYIKNQPIRLPISTTALYAFFLYYFKIADLWLGIAIAIGVLWWICVLALWWNQKGVEIDLENLDQATPNKVRLTKSMFQTKLERMEEERRRQKDAN